MNAKTCLLVLLTMMLLVLSGCTYIGRPVLKPEPRQGVLIVRIYALRDEEITNEQVLKFIEAWNTELKSSGVRVVIMGNIAVLPRKKFTTTGILGDLMKLPMGRRGEEPADRMILFVGRNFGDMLYSLGGLYLPLPEKLGQVSPLYNRGVVVAEMKGSFQNLLIRGGVKGNVIHEGYHLLGCDHGSGKKCGQQISCLKRLARDNVRQPGFVPTLTPDGFVCWTRGAVDERLHGFRTQDCQQITEKNCPP